MRQGNPPVDGVDALIETLAGRLSSTDRTPLYEQLVLGLTEAIRAGTIRSGTVLPPEPELARRLGVSRQTVGQALTALARRGLVTRRRGIGTFVAGTPVEQRLGRLYSFVQTLADNGTPPAVHLLGTRLTVDPDASLLLTGDPTAMVFEVSRLFLTDAVPLVVETVFLPATCGEQLPPSRLATDVIYDLLRDICGVEVTWAEETFSMARLGHTDAALLGVAPDDPAFLVERTAYAEDRPVEFRRNLIRGDRSRFRVRLDGPALLPKIPERGEITG